MTSSGEPGGAEGGAPGAGPAPKRRALELKDLARRAAIAVVGVLLFIYGIQLMKASTEALQPLLEGVFGVAASSPLKAAGFGWLSSYAVLSGSPIAAFSLGLLEFDILGVETTYAMIGGSRLGAAFIVIVVGLVAIARGGGKEESLSIGVLSFLVTYTTYVPALILGYILLVSGSMEGLVFQTPPFLLDFVNIIFDPLTSSVVNHVPAALSFTLSLMSLYLGLAVFDRAFHRVEVQEMQTTAIHRVLRVPHLSFLVGAGITLVSTSVSLSLGMLVPLYLKGYIRRREIIPYIMGANVTTFIDTLLAAMVLNNPKAINLVLIQMVAVIAVSAVALLGYRYYSRAILAVFHALFTKRWALWAFAVVLAAAPLILFVYG
jgi:Na+/phosphate symporter